MWPWIGFPIGVTAGLTSPIILPLSRASLIALALIFLWHVLRVKSQEHNPLFKTYHCLIFFLFALFYTHMRADLQWQNWHVEPGKKHYTIEAKVASVVWPEQNSEYQSLIVKLNEVNGRKLVLPELAKVKLNLYRLQNNHAKVLGLYKQGKVFKATVVLKPLSGFENGSGFDSVAYMRSKGVTATGYVKKLLTVDMASTRTQQQQVLDLFFHHFSHLKYFDSIVALTLGQKQGLSYQDKTQLNELGLSHLFAISGLHIAIIFGFVLLFCKMIMKWIPKCCLSPLIPSLGVIWVYIWLIGVPISALRAGFAVSFVSLFFVLRLKIDWFKLVCVIMSLSLLVQPYSMLSAAWWLSFGAVVSIFAYANLRRIYIQKGRLGPYFSELVRLQFWLGLVLLPLTVFFFQKLYLAGFVTNLIAVPVFSLLLIPLCFVATLVFYVDVGMASNLFVFADWLIDWLWVLFGLVDTEAMTISVSATLTFYLMLAVFCLLALKYSDKTKWHLLFVGLVLTPILAVSLDKRAEIDNSDQIELFFMDVGQGTSILVKVGDSALIFDLGPVYNNQWSATGAAIEPMLVYLGITRIEGIWVSHFDSDHRGSLIPLLDWPIGYLRYGCETTSKDILVFNSSFKVQNYWPRFDGDKQFKSKNDRSCVVKLDWQSGAILFPGDISRRVEKRLVELHKKQVIDLKADFIVSPHHGSQSSSSKAFIEAVSPKFAIHTNGVLNRFGFPNEQVKTRYASAGVTQYQTALHGLLHFKLNQKNGEVQAIDLQLDIWTPFWKRQNPFSFREQIR